MTILVSSAYQYSVTSFYAFSTAQLLASVYTQFTAIQLCPQWTSTSHRRQVGYPSVLNAFQIHCTQHALSVYDSVTALAIK
jgi:hypothetical protein